MNQQRIRFRQLDFKLSEFQEELEECGKWSIARKGCGPTSVAIVLANYGYMIEEIELIFYL